MIKIEQHKTAKIKLLKVQIHVYLKTKILYASTLNTVPSVMCMFSKQFHKFLQSLSQVLIFAYT